jgi:hypothetical protein
VPRHPSFLLKIKLIVLLVCKSISSNHPFIYPTIHLFAISIHLSIHIYPPIHHSINPFIHLYTYPCIHQSIDPFIHLSLSLLHCRPLSFSSQFSLTNWYARTFCVRSKRSSVSQSVNMRDYYINNVFDHRIQNLVNSNIWERSFCQMHSLNFGIGGDRTEHVLWRLQNGELEQVSEAAKLFFPSPIPLLNFFVADERTSKES